MTFSRGARWAAAAALAAVGAAAFFFATLPNVAALARRDPPTTAFIERRKASLRSEGRSDRIARVVVPLSRISPLLQRAVVLTEDQQFYRHHGVDWKATRLAVESDLDEGRLRVGGSTITQQLAKNLYLSPSRNPLRKVKEIATALRMELVLPKDRILELYLSTAEWGDGVWGAAAASRAYFGIDVAALDETQAAELAATLPHPRTSNPLIDPARTLARRDLILARYWGRNVIVPPDLGELDTLVLPPITPIELPPVLDSAVLDTTRADTTRRDSTLIHQP